LGVKGAGQIGQRRCLRRFERARQAGAHPGRFDRIERRQTRAMAHPKPLREGADCGQLARERSGREARRTPRCEKSAIVGRSQRFERGQIDGAAECRFEVGEKTRQRAAVGPQ
jgi:hypothetical protein